MRCLMLCSRAVKRVGWVTLDANSAHGPDIMAKIPPLPLEVTGILWDAIELVHGITSFYPWEARALLREIRSILTPEGMLILEQPDARVAARHLLENGDPQWLFGDASLGDPLHMCRWAYTPESLLALVVASGFSRVSMLPAQHHLSSRDFRIEARP
jgi:hypothetical protein